MEETNTFENSLPESETFCFNLEEKSSDNTTILSDYSLPDYEAFYLDDDHIEEKSSGSTTTHADFSQYDSFIFDLSINPCPPTDRSDCYHKEFAGELAHIISPPEYDCFYFKNEPDQGNFTMDVVEDIFYNPTREPRFHVPNVLPTHLSLHLDLDFTLSMIDTLLPFSSKNKNKVVNTAILASEEKSPPYSSHRGFKASKHSHHKSPMLIHEDNTPNLGVRHPHFYPLDKLKYGGIRSSSMTLNKRFDCPGFLKPLVLMVLSFDHKSFKSSASFGKSNIQILSTNVYL
ncbi:hypothetical protein Tco_1127043 [Tanacetum coccineum]